MEPTTLSAALVGYANRLTQFMGELSHEQGPCHQGSSANVLANFNELAVELFQLQYESNGAFRRICEDRRIAPQNVTDWTEIPPVPAAAFKELDFTAIPAAERTSVFLSSGTTNQQRSRHFHCGASLQLYQCSLLNWFKACFESLDFSQYTLVILTPLAREVPYSSLVHMFDTLSRRLPWVSSSFVGTADRDGLWRLKTRATLDLLTCLAEDNRKVFLMGTAFSYVHLLEAMQDWSPSEASAGRSTILAEGSFVLETGGYKGQSRDLPKEELHAQIRTRLGTPRERIVSEYGMCELSSQAYDGCAAGDAARNTNERTYHFPPWARARVTSPETGQEVPEGETGLLRIHDLANVYSTASIQTRDLGIRRGHRFQLVGRSRFAEPRGCSMMSADDSP